MKTEESPTPPTTATGRITAKAFELLEAHPPGLRWSELCAMIQESDPGFHPKTINGCVMNLVYKYPDQVYKPSRGLFRLRKYQSPDENLS